MSYQSSTTEFSILSYLVVLADGGDKDDSCYFVEAMNPLLPFVPLATDIVHAARRYSSPQQSDSMATTNRSGYADRHLRKLDIVDNVFLRDNA